jgi:hypothetical protein
MVKLIHWCASRIFDLAEWLSVFSITLHELAVSLEERAQRRKWLRWGRKHNLTVTWVPMPKMDPSEFKIPMPGEYVTPTPRPFIMLDEYEPYFATGNDPKDASSSTCPLAIKGEE